MLKRCQKVVDRTVRKMRRHGIFRTPMDVTIDKHLVCRYDRFGKIVNTIKLKYKNGTCNFNCMGLRGHLTIYKVAPDVWVRDTMWEDHSSLLAVSRQSWIR